MNITCRKVWFGEMFPGCPKNLRLAWVTTLAWLLCCLTEVSAANYYCDPDLGSMSNAGTQDSPWSRLQDVFASNKVFAAGDVIYLRNGYHGDNVRVKGHNTANVMIRPDGDAVPKLGRLGFYDASHWVASGLDVCPGHAGSGIYSTGSQVELSNSASHITLKNCYIRGALGIEGWTAEDWLTKLARGIALRVDAPYSTITGCTLENVSFGMSVAPSAPFTLVSKNVIKAFYNDGIRGLANDCIYEYNVVKDSYVFDGNHDDCFQSWSTGPTGNAGEGTVYRVILRGNYFISHTDPNQPLQSSAQGIGCYDGMFEDWVIENNVISSTNVLGVYNILGISLYGAVNCRILNNTIVENPVSGSASPKPYIRITNKLPVYSSGNIVRNNITPAGTSLPSTAGVQDHNLVTTSYTDHFTDWANFDFSLKSNSSAIGTGATGNAPAVDIAGNSRTVPYDVGAYEYAQGVLSFAASSFTRTEGNSGDSSATITVTRTGGKSGAVSVNYATANGSAQSGSDYTAASGLLNWGDGDSASKSFVVMVAGDTEAEPDETVLLTLSAPVGGAMLGSPSMATLGIQNDDLPSTFDEWVVVHGLSGANALDNATPANDGVGNLVKYALGLNPGEACTRATDGINPGIPLISTEADSLSLTYQMDSDKTDLTYTVQTSTDLVTWNTDNLSVTVQSISDNIQTLKVTTPRGADDSKFIRLKVSR